MFILQGACGNGASITVDATDDCEDCSVDFPSPCELSGGIHIGNDTQCECPDDSLINPDEACPVDDCEDCNVDFPNECELSGGIPIENDTRCKCPDEVCPDVEEE